LEDKQNPEKERSLEKLFAIIYDYLQRQARFYADMGIRTETGFSLQIIRPEIGKKKSKEKITGAQRRRGQLTS